MYSARIAKSSSAAHRIRKYVRFANCANIKAFPRQSLTVIDARRDPIANVPGDRSPNGHVSIALGLHP